jgi:hypothetical protein
VLVVPESCVLPAMPPEPHAVSDSRSADRSQNRAFCLERKDTTISVTWSRVGSRISDVRAAAAFEDIRSFVSSIRPVQRYILLGPMAIPRPRRPHAGDGKCTRAPQSTRSSRLQYFSDRPVRFLMSTGIERARSQT